VHGLVHSVGDTDVLTEHLRLLASQPSLLASLRRAALENARNLTWRQAARILADIYRETAAAARI
jgi:glycosyltransferase involved in cell wall biosynthesis